MRFIIVLLVLIVSCKESNPSLTAINDGYTQHPGKKLMETNCYVCHSPTASHDVRIGPPMEAIKRHYINDKTTKDEFVNAMQNWIKNPNEADAKMFGAVRRFGVMPKQAFPEETIEKIADYMFDNSIEQPEWFEEHFQEEMGKGKGKGQGKGQGMGNGKGMQHGKKQAASNDNDLSFEERGLIYALGTKAVLGQKLISTIKKKGTLAALEFCHVNAYPLTDSMSVVYNAEIKRVSDKPRNSDNKANNMEEAYIAKFKNDVSNNKEPEAIVTTEANATYVYYPITTNSMCLQCHGETNKDIQPNILMSIKERYPNDKAIGYSENMVRGIWKVKFNSSK